MARSMLSHNLDSINADGTITPTAGESPRSDEPGHVAFALGEYYRATGETTLKGHDLIDLAMNDQSVFGRFDLAMAKPHGCRTRQHHDVWQVFF